MQNGNLIVFIWIFQVENTFLLLQKWTIEIYNFSMKKYASLISLVIILITIYWSFSDMSPSYNENKTTSKTEFSVERALIHLKEISKEAVEKRSSQLGR